LEKEVLKHDGFFPDDITTTTTDIDIEEGQQPYSSVEASSSSNFVEDNIATAEELLSRHFHQSNGFGYSNDNSAMTTTSSTRTMPNSTIARSTSQQQ